MLLARSCPFSSDHRHRIPLKNGDVDFKERRVTGPKRFEEVNEF